MKWKGALYMVKDTIMAHKEAALFGVGTALVITCGVTAAKAAAEADRRSCEIQFDDMRLIGDEDEHKRYRIKRYLTEVVPLYLPAITSGALAITAFGMSNRALAKRAAGAAAAYSVAERMLNAYQSKAIEKFGEDGHTEIMKAVVDDIPEDVFDRARGYLAEGDVANKFDPMLNEKLYYDHVTGRIFWSTEDKIKDAESMVNKILIDTGIANINDFYAQLCLDCDSTIGEAIGWRVDDPMARHMDIVFGSRLDIDNHTPMITIGYRTCAVNLRELEHR